ncbi:MAG TPA: Lrp/AsnC family transcriptional regulator, partial [Firmicutes bacterium]|nr:Lrp/AsnC family transcriptional regulator [Bacillota bacterium]
MTAEERRLLDAAQSRFPLVAAAYAALAAETGWTEAEVLDRFRLWLGNGLVRRLGAVFDSGRLGYRSALLAAKVPAERLEAAVAEINACPGVTHNYLRDDAGTGYNLWFTLTVGPGEDLEAEARRLAGRAGLSEYLLLPATRLYKIKVAFPLSGGEAPAGGAPGAEAASAGDSGSGPAALSDEEWR